MVQSNKDALLSFILPRLGFGRGFFSRKYVNFVLLGSLGGRFSIEVGFVRVRMLGLPLKCRDRES